MSTKQNPVILNQALQSEEFLHLKKDFSSQKNNNNNNFPPFRVGDKKIISTLKPKPVA